MTAARRFAVIGDPVSHSLSPVMHNGWFKDYGLNAEYEALLLRSDDPVAAIRALKGYAGVNVTVPHKEAAAKAADRSAAEVANVLRWEADGTLSAYNTDGAGFIAALDEAAPHWRGHVKHALIVGAGGAALGIAQALSSDVARVTFINRTQSKAEALAETLPGADAAAWSDLARAFSEADLIVQCTTLGMTGQATHGWPVEACKPDAIISDIVYRPLKTDLLRAAKARGLTTMDGLGMLIHQGALAFELWFGIRPDAARARERLIQALNA